MGSGINRDKDNILFLRSRPSVFNLGDYLCTPLHYFDFHCNAYERPFFLKNKPYKVILGGGAFHNFGLDQNVDPRLTVLWGVGSSLHGSNTVPPNGDNLPYLLYGLRDPDSTSDPGKVLPCVSCMHPIAALARGDETNVFLNFDSNITDRKKFSKQLFDKERGIKLYWNCLNEFEFARIFARTGKVLTNSYHVAYWSLMSGRDVAIIGYSSKFRSLLKLTGIHKDALVEYDVKDQEKLLALIQDIITQDRFYRLNNFDEARNEFIRKNIDFAKKCKDIGFARDVSMRPFQRWRSVRRKLNYDFFEMLARMKKRMHRP